MTDVFEAGTLWDRLRSRSARALARGDLKPIPTTWRLMADGGVEFVVRELSGRDKKKAASEKAKKAGANPFLPYEDSMFVADASSTHVCLLNKFNVLEHHLLIVARAFEPQEALLDADDFRALVRCMNEIEGLGFYNGGVEAGASQSHKHLQLVPFPLSPAGDALPAAPLFVPWFDQVPRVDPSPALPFVHAGLLLEWPARTDASPWGETLYGHYRALFRLLREAGVGPLGSVENRGASDVELQPFPYNLLLTRQWMLLVPRSRQGLAGIEVNALGFAGALLLGSGANAAALEEFGPLGLLGRVGYKA